MSAPGTAPLLAALLLLSASLSMAAPTAAETLAGQVLPPAAAAAARVELWPACSGPGAGNAPAVGRPIATVRPGKDGRFQIAASDGEPLRLRVEAEGYLPAERWVGSDPELPPLRLRPAEDLELALAGPDSQPLAGLPLQLRPAASAPRAGTDGWRTPVQHAVSGPDGRARFRRAAGEPFTLFVASPRGVILDVFGMRDLDFWLAVRLVEQLLEEGVSFDRMLARARAVPDGLVGLAELLCEQVDTPRRAAEAADRR